MGVMANEPSMEDILSSIKRIIADGSDRSARTARKRGRAEEPTAQADGSDEPDGDEATGADTGADEHDILELTDSFDDGAAEAAATPAMAVVVAIATVAIASASTAQAARQALSQLSSLLVRPAQGQSNTLEGLVQEMLRPMLKEWMDAQLPDMVEGLVKKEIDRIVGRLG